MNCERCGREFNPDVMGDELYCEECIDGGVYDEEGDEDEAEQ